MDLAITCIQDRFSQPGYKLYHTLEELLVRAANNEDRSEQLREVISLYGSDFEKGELCTQLQIFGSYFTNLRNSKEVTLKEALQFLQNLSISQSSFYKQVCWLA